jgi:uncharacterized ferritin-like protein (DUF455 family)
VSSSLPLINVRQSSTTLERLRAKALTGTHLCLAGIRDQPMMVVKIGLGKLAWDLTWAADRLRFRIRELRHADPLEADVPAGWTMVTSGLADAPDAGEWMKTFFEVWLPDLQQEVRNHLDLISSVADAESALLLDELDRRLRRSLAWYAHPDTTSWMTRGTSSWQEEMSRGAVLHSGEAVPWEPFFATLNLSLQKCDAVPAREPGMEVDAAATKPIATSDIHHRRFLHDAPINIEMCAVEICGQMVLEHPNMPWEFTVDIVKQVFDEVRHAEMQLTRLYELGGHLGEFPITLILWKKYRLGADLAEQLTIQQRLGEGVGLDGGALLVDKFSEAGNGRTANLLDFTIADEVNHVGYGNRWIRYLKQHDEDAVLALEEDVRDRLAAEGLPFHFVDPVYVEGRRRAGFSERELELYVARVQKEVGSRQPG